MSNYKATKEEIRNFIVARTPLIVVVSSERERVERMLGELSKEMRIPVYYYTDAKQVSIFNDKAYKNVDSDPMPYVCDVFKKNRNATFAIGDTKRISDGNLYSQEVLNVLYQAKENCGTLILITPDRVWNRLLQFGMLTTLDYPDTQERIELIRKFIDRYKGKYPIRWSDNDILTAATLLRGFTEIQIDNILAGALINNKGLEAKHLYELTSQKSRLYSALPCVQEVYVDRNIKVSGLENLKEWLEERKKVFFATEEQLLNYDLSTPKGILLVGVPGCGKSFSAKMVAKAWDLPLYRFDAGSVYDKWVGESERNMTEALKYIDNVSPCVMWVDEIEKAMAVSDDGNDTSKRVLGQFLFWLQETKSRVFLVATANNIDALPYELFRKGRFSDIFFVDLPNADERKTAILQYADRCLHMGANEIDIDALVKISEGFSYSDIEYAVKDVAHTALINGISAVNKKSIADVFKSVIPITKVNPEKVEKIRKWGSEHARSASREEK